MDNTCDIAVSVLGYREDGEWCALALEMDLRGYGATFAAAREDLCNQMVSQISFAQFKGEMDMVFHPAEPTYFALFAQIRSDRMNTLVASGNVDDDDSEYAVAGLPIPPAHIIAAQRAGFDGADVN